MKWNIYSALGAPKCSHRDFRSLHSLYRLHCLNPHCPRAIPHPTALSQYPRIARGPRRLRHQPVARTVPGSAVLIVATKMQGSDGTHVWAWTRPSGTTLRWSAPVSPLQHQLMDGRADPNSSAATTLTAPATTCTTSVPRGWRWAERVEPDGSVTTAHDICTSSPPRAGNSSTVPRCQREG